MTVVKTKYKWESFSSSDDDEMAARNDHNHHGLLLLLLLVLMRDFQKIPLYASSCAQHSLNKILFEK
jgi:hypothetical protein